MSRQSEIDKYRHVYAALPSYRMGPVRLRDAMDDLAWARSLDCLSYLDVGCGRGEMLERAREVGFVTVMGAEAVPELCGGTVHEVTADTIADTFGAGAFDFASSFDVIEHLLPGDDVALLQNLGAVARRCVVVTANNRRSVDPTTGADLHINKRPYDEWERIVRDTLEPMGYAVTRRTDTRYVSVTWRAER